MEMPVLEPVLASLTALALAHGAHLALASSLLACLLVLILTPKAVFSMDGILIGYPIKISLTIGYG
jgi:hypothetical protein